MYRRHFLKGFAASCACAGFASRPKAFGQAASTWFFCSTPQIPEDVGLRELGGGSDDGGQIEELGGGGDGQVEFDLYGIARRARRWTKKDDGAVTDSGVVALRVGFLDGDDWQRSAFKTQAKNWLEHDLPIDFLYDKDKPHIRVSFTKQNSSEWGRDAMSIARTEPTIYVERCNKHEPDDGVRRVVVHELGHAVFALGHEHQHPDAGFDWDVKAIAKDLHWPEDRVRDNIVKPYSRTVACAGAPKYDALSIMHYPIKKEWVKSRVAFPENTVLSEGDIKCAMSVYKS
jgi:hypothetical protein